MKKPPTVPNPTRPGGRKPVEMITDRAKRYRAQKAIERPPGRRRCAYCGAPAAKGRRLDVEHRDGNEDNSNPANLVDSCRPCNAAKGAAFAKAGKGKRTRQYNPGQAPRHDYDAYKMDILIGRGFVAGDKAAAWERINRNYTAEERSRYTRQLWRERRQHGTDTWTVQKSGQEDVPF